MKFSASTDYKYPTVVRHQGMSIVLALRQEDEVCNIYYRVLATDPAQPDDDKCWSDRKKMSFPDQIRPAGMSLVTVDLKTAEQTADAPFQALSDGKHVYLFRQSTGGTLYVDRFVFDPVEKSLNPNWEPRYQRSQKRDVPASRKDSLGARDMEGEPFLEPTTELAMVKDVEHGRFSVLLLPGRLPSEWRWQIFVTNAKGEIDSFSIRRSEDGLFGVKEKEVQQTCFKWAASERRFLTGPTALLYMQQEKAQDEYGRTQQLKRGARVMLAAPVGSARYALELDGVNDYVEIPSNSGLDLGANFTIEAWIKPADGYGVPRDGYISIVSRRGPDESSPPAYLLGLNGQGNLLFWTYAGSKDSQLTSKAIVPVDTWSHIAGVLEKGTLKVYINGLLDDNTVSNAVTPQPSVKEPVRIGADPVSGNYFKGQLNQVRLWNLSRDQADIEENMHRPLAGNEPGLVGHWPFDEGMGDAIHDQAGDHHGQLYVGSALEFDGVDDYVKIPALDLSKSETMTIEAWIKPADITTNTVYEIVRQEAAEREPDWRLAFQEHGQILSFRLLTGGSYQALDVPIRPTDYTDGQWHHVAATYDGQTQRLYEDGDEIGSKSKTGHIRFSANAVHSIGSWKGKGLFFKGQIGHVRFWKVARTKEEIQDSYDRLTGDQSGLLSYWPLDEGEGVTIRDQAAKNHGQLCTGIRYVLEFDGLDDYVEVADPFENDTAFTISLWIKPAQINDGRFHGFVGKEAGQDSNRYRKPGLWLAPDQGGLHYYSFDPSGKSYTDILENFFENDNEGVHLAWVKQGTEYRFYRNGELFATRAAPQKFYTHKDSGYWIGRVDNFWRGQIGDVQIWRCARTQAEIEQDKDHRLAGDEPGLACYWPLDEGAGDTLYDLASGNHGQFYAGSGDNLARKWVKGPRADDVRTKWVACDNPHEKWIALAPIAVLDYGLSRQGTLAMLPDQPVVTLGLKGDGSPVDLSIPRFQAEADQMAKPMGVVRRDKQGLSVCAGLLELARSGDTPYLLDGADGLIHLYFRGDHSQFLVAQYDTLTARAEYALPLGTSDGGPQLRFIARQPGSHMNDYTIKVEEATGQTCRVTLNGPDGVNETWQNVPRQLEQFLAVLNGTATADANDPLVEKRKLVLYDYNNKQNVQRQGVPDLTSGDIPFFGSTLFGVGVDNLPEPGQALQVQSGKVTEAKSAGKDCAWVPEPPGHALEFDGEDDYVDVARPPHLLDIPGDLTMEAWVKVAPGDHNNMRVVNYHTQELRFTLGLNRAEEGEGYQVVAGNGDKAIQAVGALVPPDEWTHLAAVYNASTALRLDGQGYVDCGNDVTLDVSEAMTVEAWVTPDIPISARSQPEVILSKWGSTKAEQSWRLYIDPDGKPCFETQNDNNKLTSVKADLPLEAGQAYHLAGIFDTASKKEVALQFNGTDSVSLGNPKSLWIKEEITLEAWVKVQATDSVRNIIARGTDGVYLRIKDDHYQVGAGKQCASAEIPEEDKAAWVHLAGVYDRQEKVWILYRYGVELSRHRDDARTPQPAASEWKIGGSFNGQLNNVRLWDGALSRQEIVENMNKPAKDIKGVAGNWAFDEQDKLQARGKTVKDYSNNKNDGTLSQDLTAESYVDIDKGSNAQKMVVYPAGQEVKVTLGFDGVDDYVELPEMDPDYAKGFTVEAWVRYHSFQKWSRIIDFGNGEAKDNILLANGANTNNLEFHVRKGKEASQVSAPGVLVKNTWMHLAATVDEDGKAALYVDGVRQPVEDGSSKKPDSLPRTKNYIGRSNWAGDDYFDGDIREVRIWNVVRSEAEIKANMEQSLSGDEPGLVGYWPLDEASLQIGQVRDHSRYGYNGVLHGGTLVWPAGDNSKSIALDPDKALLSTNTRVNMGRSASEEGYFQGTLDEVRLWQVGRGEGQLHYYRDHRLPGNAEGLVSEWRFEEGRGKTASDVKGSNHGRLVHPEAEQIPTMWIFSALNAWLTLYVNGQVAAGEEIKLADHGHYGLNNRFTIGAMLDKDETLQPQADKPLQNMAGCIDEVRLWNTVRTPEQLRDNMYRALFGGEEGLVGYWTLDTGAGKTIEDRTGNKQTGTLKPKGQGPQWIDSSAPIGNEGPEVRQVYDGQPKPGFNRRIIGPPAAVEYGDMQWDAEGNLFGVMKRGYIFQEEAIQLVTGFKVGDLELHFIGQVQTAPTLIGYIEGAPPVPSENLTVNDPEEDDYVGTSSIQLTEAQETIQLYSASRDWGSDTLEDLKAGLYWEAYIEAGWGAPIGPQISVLAASTKGKFGYHRNLEESHGTLSSASLTAGTSKTLTKSLALCGGWEEKQDYDQTGQARYLNPEVGQRYLPNNMGYALVKSATADLFALRLKRTDSLVAFQVVPNPDIPEDWNIIMFPLNPKYVKNGTLDGMVGLVADPDYPNAIVGERGSYFKPLEAYALKERIEREAEKIEGYYDNFEAVAKGQSPDTGAGPEGLWGELPKEEKLGYDWQTGRDRRSLVNTYVWTADGGFYAEEEQFSSIRQESLGGSYHSLEREGIFVERAIAVGVGHFFELDALWGSHLNVTVSKSQEDKAAFGLQVEVQGEGYLFEKGEWNEKTQKFNYTSHACPGKVDGYRFMTFYLAPRSNTFDEFFKDVVDPEWLKGQGKYGGDYSPNARALREAQARPNEVWRVLHRVTYVSRIPPQFERAPAEVVPKDVHRPDNIEANRGLIQEIKRLVPPQPSLIELGVAVDELLGQPPISGDDGWSPGELENIIPWWTKVEKEAKKEIRRDILEYLKEYYESGLAQAEGPAPEVESGSQRVRDGLQVLYTFAEGQGTIVHDVSGVGEPLDLRIAKKAAIGWIKGGLTITGDTLLSTSGPASRLTEAILANQAFTVEAWIVEPTAHPQHGLARIVTLSNGLARRNYTLGQFGEQYLARVRTDKTDPNASQQLLSATGNIGQGLTHLVFTCAQEANGAGAAKFYLNGQEVSHRRVDVDFSSWDDRFRLGLANEFNNGATHTWRGTYHLVAVYSRALTLGEIRQNYEFGADTNLAPVVEAGEDRVINLEFDPSKAAPRQVQVTLQGKVIDDQLAPSEITTQWIQISGPEEVIFENAGALETKVNFSQGGTYVLRLTAEEPESGVGTLKAYDQVTITVKPNQRPLVHVEANPPRVNVDEPVTLEATVLDDGLPDPPGKLSLTWLKVKGPGKVDFDNAHADVTRARFSQPGQYKLRFKANDGHLVGRDQVTVEVRPSRDSKPGKPKPPTKQQGHKKPGKADRQPQQG